MNKTNVTVWNRVYNILNITVIFMIIMQLVMQVNLNLFIVLSFAALLILGLLDSLDRNAFKENMFRHVFDFILLVLFGSLFFGA
ncbi:hypothetical protein [Macrococcus armenti]|uniref:hypothetical protein n=2 Tax=Macrococcus armenti TaxID=2875764 RepID=UPI001CCE268C|nr:hypothetical protein [Macrococcus armenti]UBH08454.1 hypothetical protein LAU41_10870 [Macrococcus armenti]UBH10740.1 hypothetical protein LAU38_11070 [Macrococcus armenti]UBH15222.1 hypothetical protein LAU44_10930 [Macrococcus armenti]UBH17581.1 hypothetical protein LAU39_10970 [Macrococcus armenti]UBH19847.1 hypothetical protein LAU40_10965 [Macrococcus armenti]